MTPLIAKVPLQKPASRQSVVEFDPVDYYDQVFRAIVKNRSGALYLITGPVQADTSVMILRLSSRSPQSINDVFANWPKDGFRRRQILAYNSEVQIGTIKVGNLFGLGDLRKGEADFRKTPVEEIWVETAET